ncbi:hypothetical protein HID58_078698 [Brassica napus]|uniref:Uncharacterized protein n=1 Tax=Brassica napus TaxID=3708 RepID=A0ABQ7YUV7_BRANA|nr:hypothetical protein HID58_078698 [Brassica napus]
MGITDTEVYVCLRTPPDPNPGWYILRCSSNLIAASSFPSQHLESIAGLTPGVASLPWEWLELPPLPPWWTGRFTWWEAAMCMMNL